MGLLEIKKRLEIKTKRVEELENMLKALRSQMRNAKNTSYDLWVAGIDELVPRDCDMFLINGYWKDDKTAIFKDYLVSEYGDDGSEDTEDDNIFHYGLSEAKLKEAVKLGEAGALDFVITEYRLAN